MATPILSPAHQLGKRTYRQLQAYARSRFVGEYFVCLISFILYGSI